MTCMLVNNADGKVILRGDRENVLQKAESLCESVVSSYTIYQEIAVVSSKLKTEVIMKEVN